VWGLIGDKKKEADSFGGLQIGWDTSKITIFCTFILLYLFLTGHVLNGVVR